MGELPKSLREAIISLAVIDAVAFEAGATALYNHLISMGAKNGQVLKVTVDLNLDPDGSEVEAMAILTAHYEAKLTARDEALKIAEEALKFYVGDFDGREGSRWNGDIFFIEDKFGGGYSDKGAAATEALERIRGMKDSHG